MLQPLGNSGLKKSNFFILYMQWQYDPQKAQLEQKTQICATFHKRKYNHFCTVVLKRKREAHLPTCPPDNFFSHKLQYPKAILASGKKGSPK